MRWQPEETAPPVQTLPMALPQAPAVTMRAAVVQPQLPQLPQLPQRWLVTHSFCAQQACLHTRLLTKPGNSTHWPISARASSPSPNATKSKNMAKGSVEEGVWGQLRGGSAQRCFVRQCCVAGLLHANVLQLRPCRHRRAAAH